MKGVGKGKQATARVETQDDGGNAPLAVRATCIRAGRACVLTALPALAAPAGVAAPQFCLSLHWSADFTTVAAAASAAADPHTHSRRHRSRGCWSRAPPDRSPPSGTTTLHCRPRPPLPSSSLIDSCRRRRSRRRVPTATAAPLATTLAGAARRCRKANTRQHQLRVENGLFTKQRRQHRQRWCRRPVAPCSFRHHGLVRHIPAAATASNGGR